MSKIFYKAFEFYSDIKKLREEGVFRGENVGFHSLDEYYNMKLGRCTYLYSSPYSGKSEFVFEMALNMAAQYNWNIAIYSPETGTKEETVAKLVFKLTGQELYAKHRNAIDDESLKQALGFINQHFIFIDPDQPQTGDVYDNALLTLVDFYSTIIEAEAKYKIKIQLTVIDPFNEIAHNFSKDEGRQDLYIERMLGIAKRDARVRERHNIIVTHIADQAPIVKDGVRYYPPATARELAGGQAWFRKADMMISMWRPPLGLSDAEGRPWQENEIHIIIQKVKPHYCGKRGTVTLYYNTENGRYYELINNKKYYAFEYAQYQSKLQEQGKLLI